MSPSLSPNRMIPAYEMKFLLGHAQADHVLAWARLHLALDAHADPALGNAYAIRSVYYDTAQLDVYQQTPGYRRHKFRLRRYGDERGVFLERKFKLGDRVSKRRTLIGEEELGLLCDSGERGAPSAERNGAPRSALRASLSDPDWSGYWFYRRLLAGQLQPRCVISYERVAHIGMSAQGPLRLTLDRNVHCALTQTCDFQVTTSSIPLLADAVILELKFRAALPALFKSLLEQISLSPRGVSKYRAGIQAWGLAGATREVG